MAVVAVVGVERREIEDIDQLIYRIGECPGNPLLLQHYRQKPRAHIH
jgi:hypothetical protein